MQSLLSRFNHFFEVAPGVLLPFRWLVLLVFLAVTGVMVGGMFKHFSMDMSLESWFQDDDPIKLSLDEFRDQFGSDDGVYFVYRAKDDDVFSEKSLQLIRDLHIEIDNARVALTDDERRKKRPTDSGDGDGLAAAIALDRRRGRRDHRRRRCPRC